MKVVSRLIVFNSIAVIMLLATILYMVYGPTHMALYYNQPYTVTGNMVPGGEIKYTVQYCKDYILDGTFSRFLENENGDSIELAGDGESVLPKTGEDCNSKNPGRGTLTLRIPEWVGPGKYRIKIVANFRVNIFRSIDKEYVTKHFTIKNNLYSSH